MWSPLNAILEQTKTGKPAVSPRRMDLSWLCFEIKHAEHLHAIRRDSVFLLDNSDVTKAEGFKSLGNLV
jgi:hypothetical protein